MIWDKSRSDAWNRGCTDAYQDDCENCHFASVGGLEARNAPLQAPHYVAEADAADYLEGYQATVQKLYGDDWRTCEFSWKPALELR